MAIWKQMIGGQHAKDTSQQMQVHQHLDTMVIFRLAELEFNGNKSWAQKNISMDFQWPEKKKYIEHPTVWDHRWTIIFKLKTFWLQNDWC